MDIVFPPVGSVAYLVLCLGAWLIFASSVSYVLIVLDRRRAETGGVRLPEPNLLWIAALGGSPGAALALRRCRDLRFSMTFRGWLRAITIAQIVLATMASLPPKSMLGVAEIVASVAMGHVRATERDHQPGRVVLNSQSGVSNIMSTSSRP